jgi:4-carboxymuconolactone decarboxylase
MVARIAPLEPPYRPEVAKTLARLMGSAEAEPLKLFRTVAHNPAILDKFRSTGTYLLNFGTVAPIEREIVILRTTARCGSEYEWGVHVALFSDAVGLTPEQVAATTNGSLDAFDARQQLLVRMCDELHETANVSDELWTELLEYWKPEQIVELLTLAGQYRLVSYFTNALRIDLEPFAPTSP